MKSEIANMSEKLDTLVAQRETDDEGHCVTAALCLSEREAMIQASKRHISDESEKGNNSA